MPLVPTNTPTPPPRQPPTPPPSNQPVHAVESQTGDTSVMAIFDFQHPPLVVAEEPMMSVGATTNGAIDGSDSKPINGGVILDGSVSGTPGGVAELNRILATEIIIEEPGMRVLGPFNCAGMTGHECCLSIKHQVRDSDVHNRAIQCHLDYDMTTCKKKYELKQSARKVWIHANHKYFVTREPKVTNKWTTCTDRWGSTRDWSTKFTYGHSDAPTSSSLVAPTPPVTFKPTAVPTHKPTSSNGSTSPPDAADLVETSGPCHSGYTCMQTYDFGNVDTTNTEWKIDLSVQSKLTTTEAMLAYQYAIKHWRNIIVGDLESVSTAGFADDGCAASYPEIIDDMHICGRDTEIDGVGGVLGSASITYVRSTDGTVISGNMEFDKDDVQAMINDGTFQTVITHEMGHILGLGSLWQQKGLVVSDGNGGYVYTGQHAIDVWKNTWQCTTDFPPVEAEGDSGTAGAHWDEDCMVNEVRCCLCHIAEL